MPPTCTTITFRILLLRGLFQLLRFLLAYTEKPGARAHFKAIFFHARLQLAKLLVEGLSARAITDQVIPTLFIENFIELKFVLVVDQEPAGFLRYHIRAIT